MSNYVSVNFFDAKIWQSIMLVGVLFASLVIANVLKTTIPFLKKKLIPNSVLGGCLLLIISTICFYTKGEYLFNLPAFSSNGSGIALLEIITYHCLGIGFVAMTLRPSESKLTKKRSVEVFNQGIVTVSEYLIQATVGIIITVIASTRVKGLVPGSGILLCFGYGQGTGQALNIGKNFDAALGTQGVYGNMGLSLAACGFLVASIAGIMVVNHLRKTGKIEYSDDSFKVKMSEVQGANEVPNSESVDKFSMQIGFVLIAYALAFLMMWAIGKISGGLIGTIYGFNFIFASLSAVILKAVLNFLKKIGVLRQEYLNTYLLNRISGFAFDLMIVAGICAIQIDLIANYLGTILVLGVVGAVVTFYYTKYVAKKLYPDYEVQMFLSSFGMYTGTASTGMMPLRAADPELKTPASENIVYQNFPAIIFGVPMLLLASGITNNGGNMLSSVTSLILAVVYFAVLNIVLFRSLIFKKKKK